MTIKLDAKTTGPLFTKDVRRTVRENARSWLDTVAEQGEGYVRENTPVLTGRLRDAIHGRTRSLAGKKWQLTAVVTSTVNQQMPRFRGYTTYIETGVWKGSGPRGRATKEDRANRDYRGARMFRKAAARLRSSIRTHLLNLTKGLE